jgi:hypothetical protein
MVTIYNYAGVRHHGVTIRAYDVRDVLYEHIVHSLLRTNEQSSLFMERL